MIDEALTTELERPTLSDVDWNFDNSRKGKSIHSIHPYPAKFIPEIPGNLIDVLQPSKEGLILDPFCGSGVSLVEAQKRGYRSIGVDLNPIACLISRVKTSYIELDKLWEEAHDVLRSAQRLQSYTIPSIPNLDHWFESSVQVGLSKLLVCINGRNNSIVKDALLLACSSIIVKVSNQDSDTRYAAVKKDVSERHVYDFFEKAVKQLLSVKGKEQYSHLGHSRVILGNILTTDHHQIQDKVSLLVTSPPYPNAYEYWLYHKYRMWWLGYNPLDVKENEIGARAHFFKKKHHTGENFSAQMEKLFENVLPSLLPDAFAVFVVGRSIIHGKEYANHDTIVEAGEKFGMVHRETIVRNMNNSRKSFNLAHARIKQEYIVILQNTKQ